MIEFAVLDKFYDASMRYFGRPPTTCIFDKRVLWPLSALPGQVLGSTKETLPESRLSELLAARWIPDLVYSGDTSAAKGFPAYVPERVGLFLRLERAGVSSLELRAFAEFEEGIIDDVITGDDTPYDDDDLAVLARDYEARICLIEDRLFLHEEHASDRESLQYSRSTIEELRTSLGAICAAQRCGLEHLRAEVREQIQRQAFHVRERDEFIRLSMIQSDRATLAAGYSFFVAFREIGSTGLRYEDHSFGPIDWQQTLKSPFLTGEADTLPIRLPGLVIEDDRITVLGSRTPAEYADLWSRYRLDDYHRAFAAQDGKRLCARCLNALPHDASPRQTFCGTACKNAAKAQAYRARHPDRVKLSRHGLLNTYGNGDRQ